MSELLSRFHFHSVEFSLAMYFAAIVIWLIVVGCAVSSILVRPWSIKARISWIVAVVLLPVLGLLLYLPFSCRKEEFTGLMAVLSGCAPKGRE